MSCKRTKGVSLLCLIAVDSTATDSVKRKVFNLTKRFRFSGASKKLRNTAFDSS